MLLVTQLLFPVIRGNKFYPLYPLTSSLSAFLPKKLITMAAAEFQLNPTVWDPTWSRLPEPEKIGGLNSSRPQAREDWVVRLRFKQNG